MRKKKFNNPYSVLDEMRIDNRILDNENRTITKEHSETSMVKQSSGVSEAYKPVIKNNNFEINNNFYGNIKIENQNPVGNTIITNSLSYSNFSIYDSTDNNKLLCFLVTPRIMKFNNRPYLFQLSPAITKGKEIYIFKWTDIKNFIDMGYINITVNTYITGDGNNLNIKQDNKTIEIEACSLDECKNYVNGFNVIIHRRYNFKL
jgi:hypothetical protein